MKNRLPESSKAILLLDQAIEKAVLEDEEYKRQCVLQNKAMEELGYQVNATDMDTLSELGLIGERISEDDNTTSTEFDLAEIKRLYPFWRIIHTLNKIPAKQ